LKIITDIAIIYYITEFELSEISIFLNTAVTNIRKYPTYVIQVCTVGQLEYKNVFLMIKLGNKRFPVNM
jgi:hypothetical protein